MFKYLCPKACRILQINHSILRASLTKSRDWALGFASLKMKYDLIIFFFKGGGGRDDTLLPFSFDALRKETGRGEGDEN